MEFLSSVTDKVPMWVVLSTVAVVALYWYITSGLDYWERAGVPYVKAPPLIGNFLDIMRRPFHDVELERYQKNGRIYGTFEGKKPVLTVGEPEVLRDILVKDFQFFSGRRNFATGDPMMDKMVSNLQGEDWKRIRTLMTPAFTTGRIKKMTSILTDSAKTVTENFTNAAKEGKPVDMKRYFGAYTMDVIVSTAFGTKIDSHNDPENPFVTTARRIFNKNISWTVVFLLLFPFLMKLTKRSFFDVKAMKFFKEATFKILEERRKSGVKRNDFLQLMIDAVKDSEGDVEDSKDDAADIGHDEYNSEIFKHVYSSKTMSNDEVVSQCILFFIAGYDTTASTLTFAAYELALNPDIQDRLISEIDETIIEKGGLNYESVSSMKYLDCVISETLRKHPPATRGERLADDDYHIKFNNISTTVTKGMIVGIPIYAMHHDPEFYPDPEKFDPERFTPEQKSGRHPYVYLPFGAGPRNCIAMRFALMEAKLCLATFLSQCRVSMCAETKVPLDFYIGQGLMQPKAVILKVDLRKDCPKA